MFTVGFLKFLKRDRKKEDDLDLPPAPPEFETAVGSDFVTGFEADLSKDVPNFSEINASDLDKDIDKLEFPESDNVSDVSRGYEMPEFPSFPDIEKKSEEPNIPLVTAPGISKPSELPETPLFTEELPPVNLDETKVPPKARFYHAPALKSARYAEPDKTVDVEEISKSGNVIYVRVDKFKSALENIGTIRSNFRKSYEALGKLANIKNEEDKNFDKVKHSLEDLQKKVIFIDKTLFKGD